MYIKFEVTKTIQSIKRFPLRRVLLALPGIGCGPEDQCGRVIPSISSPPNTQLLWHGAVATLTWCFLVGWALLLPPTLLSAAVLTPGDMR